MRRHEREDRPGFENVVSKLSAIWLSEGKGGNPQKRVEVTAAKTFYVKFFNAKIIGNLARKYQDLVAAAEF